LPFATPADSQLIPEGDAPLPALHHLIHPNRAAAVYHTADTYLRSRVDLPEIALSSQRFKVQFNLYVYVINIIV
jgi:hypothetical protein